MYALPLSLVLSVVVAVPPAAENPCTNGSFEILAPNGFPADWGPVGETVEVSSDAHTGQRALLFRRTAKTATTETGLNRGPLLDRLKGGMDFWYKAVAATDAKLNIHVIPMDAEPREATGSPRATFTVPEDHIGDGRWHHTILKYDFTKNAKAKSVHFAVRIVGAEGELLLDDVSYVERVGGLLRVGKVKIDEDPSRPGQRCTVRAEIENAGDAAAEAVRAAMVFDADRNASPAIVPVGDLAPDEKRWVTWTHEGERVTRSRVELMATSGDVETRKSYAVAPELVLRSFGPSAPVAMQNTPLTIVCVVENPGAASLVNPTATFLLPSGPASRTIARLHSGRSHAFSVPFSSDRQAVGIPISVRVSAGNLEAQPTAESTLLVGSAAQFDAPPSRLNAAATDEFAVLENEHVRLLFRRNEFGFGPAELLVVRGGESPATVAWLPRLARVVLAGVDGTRREHTVLTPNPPRTQDGPPASLEFTWSSPAGDAPSCQARVRFTLAKNEKHIQADYELTCTQSAKLLAFDGPMLYVLDRDEAVLPGLEWLVDDEVSSGTLDIAEGHPHRVRYVVHPNMVTIPAAGIHGKYGTVGLLWDLRQKWDGLRDRPSMVFASPDRFGNQRAHLMGLFLPSVPEFVAVNQREAAASYPLEPGRPLRMTARLLADAEAPDALAAIDAWARLFGVPEPAPLPRGSYDREIEFSMQAYITSLWMPETKSWWTTKGGGMMSQPGQPRSFVADLLLGATVSPSEEARRACMSRAKEVLDVLGGEARIDAQRFGGRADLAMANPATAAAHLAGRGKDGAWRFDADQQHTTGPFVGMDYHELGPDEAVEVGTCARRAFEVLNYARIAGDAEAYDAMRQTLVLMESFRVPRAAQVWEVPVHTPDVLAAADAVDAYIEAYRFSGDDRWLRDAVTWARRGLPFIYLWDDPQQPFLVGGSIPVFGATWYQGSWFGRPVQWNGLRYADALLKLDEFDRTYPWRRIAESIIRSAMHQQAVEGEDVALWPDNISVIDGERCPWVFAPRQIIGSVLKLTGRDEEPGTVMLGEAPRRLHISATAAISAAAWDGGRLAFHATYPTGEQGVILVSNVSRPAQVLLDGQPLPPREDIETGAQPGWRYDESNAYLAIRVARDGQSAVEIQGGEFRSVSRLPTLVRKIAFEFDTSSEGWMPAHHIGSLRGEAGELTGKITGPDPYLIRTLVDVAGDRCPVILLRMRLTAGYGGQLFWMTSTSPAFSEQQAVRFAVQPDGRFHEYRLEPGKHPGWAGQVITALRIDPGNGAAAGEFAIDYVRGGTAGETVE